MKVFPRWLVVCVTWIDYSLCLPLLAYLPRRWTRPLETLRGWINWRADFDWRTLSLGHGYIRAATERGMARVVQQTGRPASATELCQLTRQRFICTSREELDSWRLKRIDYARLPHHIAGLEHLLTARDQGVGVILAKAHSDSLYIGLALLARAGLTVNLMGTKVIFDPRVPPGIKKHYEQNPVFDSDFVPLAIQNNIALFDRFNAIRNNQSYAHDNVVLGNMEAEFVVRTMINTISFIDAIERYRKSNSAAPALEDIDTGNDDLPF